MIAAQIPMTQEETRVYRQRINAFANIGAGVFLSSMLYATASFNYVDNSPEWETRINESIDVGRLTAGAFAGAYAASGIVTLAGLRRRK